MLIWSLVVIDLVLMIALPVILARITPAAVAAIAIFYGLSEIGVGARKLLLAAALFLCLVFAALPFKEYLRVALYNGDAFVPGTCSLPLSRAATTVGPSGLSRHAPATGGRVSGGLMARLIAHMATASRAYSQAAAATPPARFGLRLRPLHGVWGLAEYGAARAINRLNRLGDFAYVIAKTPSHVPFTYGATYEPIVGTIVPRIVWPGKPLNDGGGQFFGHRYDFLDPSDTIHDVNLPVITEGWINGGWAGILISATAVGILVRVVWCRWIGDTGAPGNVVIGMAVLSALVDQESSLALVVGGAIHALILFGVIEYVLRKSQRTVFGRSLSTQTGSTVDAVA